jgi:WG containing repeat
MFVRQARLGILAGMICVCMQLPTPAQSVLNPKAAHDHFPERKNGKWGFSDLESNWKVKPTFDAAGIFAEGLAPVKIDGQFGYVSLDGKLVIKPSFASAGSFSEGLALVRKDKKYGFIDKKGDITRLTLLHAILDRGESHWWRSHRKAFPGHQLESRCRVFH